MPIKQKMHILLFLFIIILLSIVDLKYYISFRYIHIDLIFLLYKFLEKHKMYNWPKKK